MISKRAGSLFKLGRCFSDKQSLYNKTAIKSPKATPKKTMFSVSDVGKDPLKDLEVLKKWNSGLKTRVPSFLGLGLTLMHVPTVLLGYDLILTPYDDPFFVTCLERLRVSVVLQNSIFVPPPNRSRGSCTTWSAWASTSGQCAPRPAPRTGACSTS